MADHVPLQFGWALWDFGLRLLYFIFSESAQAQTGRRLDGFRWLAFGDRQEKDFGRIPPRSVASGFDSVFYARVRFGNRHRETLESMRRKTSSRKRRKTLRFSGAEANLARVKMRRKPARSTHTFSHAKARLNLRPGEWSIVAIDSAPLRKKARRAYEKALGDLDVAKAESERFQNEDKPGFSRWLHANFGAQLTEIRELQTKVFAAQGLVTEVQEEFYYGRYRSVAGAYKKVVKRRAESEHSDAAQEAPDPDFADDTGEEDDADPFPPGDKEFWQQLRDGVDEMWRTQHMKQQERGGNRLKELYRQLARRLHPDKTKEISPRKLEWWHQTQAAYENGDVEQLETILTLIEVEERGTKETSLSLLAKLTAEFKRSLRALKRQLADFRKDIAWNFSQMTDLTELFRRTRAMLEEDRAKLRFLLGKYEAQIQVWQTSAEVPRKRVRAARTSRAWQDEEWF
jgi:hypothetical protein